MKAEDSMVDATASATTADDDTKMAEDEAPAITKAEANASAIALPELLVVNRSPQELTKQEQDDEQRLIQQELTLRQSRESAFAHLHWKLDGTTVHQQMIPRTLLPSQLQKRFTQQKQKAAASAASSTTTTSNRVKLRLAKDTTEDTLRAPPTQSDIANISRIRQHQLTAEYPTAAYRAEDEVVNLNEVTPAQAINYDLTAGYEYPTALKAPYHQVSGAVSQSINANPALHTSTQHFPYTDHVIARQNGSDVPAPVFPIIIPSYAAWFDTNSIHDIERRAFPEMLLPPADREDGGSYKSKQPALRLVKTYKDIRDYIIATYRLNPRVYLTATACRRHIVGDTSAVIRIHHFLNRWGLINYRVDAGTVPVMHNAHGSVNYPVLRHLPNGALIPHTAGQSSATDSINTTNDSKAIAADPLQRLMNTTDPTGKLALRHHILRGAASTVDPIYQQSVQHPKPDTPIHCAVCKKATTSNYYVPKQEHSYTLCPVCYADGLYNPIYTSADFLRNSELTEVSHASQSKWTQEETLKLLEALTRYGDDWSAVSETVGSKSRDECVLHFLSLPIEEPFLAQHYADVAAKQPATTDDAQKVAATPQDSKLFADTPNLLMTTIAFLASTISPSVASAAAQAAIGQLQPPHAKSADKQKNAATQQHSLVSPDQLDILTPYGPGQLVGRRAEDSTVIVQLPFATAYVAEADVKPLVKAQGQNGSASNDVEMTAEGADTKQNGSAPTMTDLTDPDTLASLTNTAVSTAALKAGELAAEEERKVLRLVAQLVQAQMRKVELKLSQLEELNVWSQTQKTNLERSWQQVIAERVNLAPINLPPTQQPMQQQTPQQSHQPQPSPPMQPAFPNMTSPAPDQGMLQQQQNNYNHTQFGPR